MRSLFVVRFIRNDGKPDEEYVYNTYEEAQKHYDLFQNDDSGLYERIEIVDYHSREKKCKDMEFDKEL